MGFLDHLLHSQPETYEKKKLFKIGKVLGSGTYGQVKQATIISTGQTCAIKSIRKEVVKGHEELIKSEMNILAMLDHPNIMKLLDWFESRDKYYMVFDLATGGELFDRIIEMGKFTEKDGQTLVKPIFGAIAYMHAKNVVHRDLKPENLLFRSQEPDSPLVIADFGISKTLASSDETMSTLCGSFGYTAPEILLRRGYDKSVDLYSMGVIIYTMLCGYTPYPLDDTARFLDLARYGRVEFHKRYWSNISQECKDFIKMLLDPNPTKRGTAEEVLHHPWFTQGTATDHDLLADVRENFDAKGTFRKAVRKVIMANVLKRAASKSSSHDSDGWASDDDDKFVDASEHAQDDTSKITKSMADLTVKQ